MKISRKVKGSAVAAAVASAVVLGSGTADGADPRARRGRLNLHGGAVRSKRRVAFLGLMAVIAFVASSFLAAPAQAATYQTNVMLKSERKAAFGDPACLQENSDHGVSFAWCDAPTRWNVKSYASDVNNYYGRVQIQSVTTGRCLFAVFDRLSLSSHPYLLQTASCDAGSNRDQWDLTWVGNNAGNPSDAFQFYQPASSSCLDSGQSSLLYEDMNGSYCSNQTNLYQMWAMVK